MPSANPKQATGNSQGRHAQVSQQAAQDLHQVSSSLRDFTSHPIKECSPQDKAIFYLLDLDNQA